MEDSAGPKKSTLSHLPQRPPVDLEFQDLTYTVPQGRKGSKLILRSISGQFRSGQLSAILGPSGAGKSTLLNILAGYKTFGAAGSVLVNGEPRNMKQFRKMSRYIMQDNLLQPMLTVEELMMVAADLKLNRQLSKEDKLTAITEILVILRLAGARHTATNQLSGGEKKRLSVALELINNPPVIFLDEPTTGLDHQSSTQCISLLKLLAEGGRTVICSIHAPSAKLISQFDNVYIVSAGQCMFQGNGEEIVPFLSKVGLDCPKHYSPVDFIIEVANGDYGYEFLDKMSSCMDNGRNTNYLKKDVKDVHQSINEINSASTSNEKKISPYNYDCSVWYQFKILLKRFWLQTFRDSGYLIFKMVLYAVLGILLGSFYLNMGHDGSMTIYNFGFCYTCIIAFLYLPLMPVLLHFPVEVQIIKREHFNQWYGLTAYYLAMSFTTLPLHTVMTVGYVSIAYFMSDQPIELQRISMFLLVCVLTTFISESFGLMISSVLNLVNGMFLGPCLAVPIMLLAVYGIGQGSDIPPLIRFAMYFSYLRYGMEGLIIAIYGYDRPVLPCPEEVDICPLRDPAYLIKFMGMANVIFWVDILALIACFLIFRLASFYFLRQRLRPNKTFAALHVIGRIVKSHFSISR
ncbi:hypothetical protein PPYR_07395 [Photinus pyralis]|uniref:ABC transporter domain-containing protein n=2 Tax=Photinus pyralis TaxID=7054 RepID=A0A5N4AQ82_PHOPY|nr:ATP-binding cassette sub-family G member 4-like isoform X1 [Photinus pyralis]KAB0799515.1 hypothetical protein PPYR_07395 [Photinus pyralis]